MTNRLMLCSICARGGSKGVVGKNVRPMAGKPLIAHSIAQALETGLFAHIAVSSDDPAILEAAERSGADILVRRPDEMASDVAPKAAAIRHCAEQAEAQVNKQFDIFVDLDATAPLRLPEDIRGAVALLVESGADNVITGAPARRSPYFNLVERRPDGTVGLSKPSAVSRRQDSPACFDMNASIYVWNRASMTAGPKVFSDNTRLYEMPHERSLDIDSELDWEFVEFLMLRSDRSPR